jgi:hypothetical protein
VLGHLALQPEAAEPSVSKVQVRLLAEPPVRADTEAVADQQHADHQLGINGGPAGGTVVAGQGVAGLSGAMQGLLSARKVVLEAVVAIDRDMRLLARSSQACQRLMTIPGVGQLTALAFVATIDAPERFRRSRCGSLSRSGAAALPVRRDRLRRQHLEVWRRAVADPCCTRPPT